MKEGNNGGFGGDDIRKESTLGGHLSHLGLLGLGAY